MPIWCTAHGLTTDQWILVAHLSPGHLKQYADRTLIGSGKNAETGTPEN
jgi:hypothetical protein